MMCGRDGPLLQLVTHQIKKVSFFTNSRKSWKIWKIKWENGNADEYGGDAGSARAAGAGGDRDWRSTWAGHQAATRFTDKRIRFLYFFVFFTHFYSKFQSFIHWKLPQKLPKNPILSLVSASIVDYFKSDVLLRFNFVVDFRLTISLFVQVIIFGGKM